MSSVPANPPNDTPPVPPYWSGEDDWLVILVVLPQDDVEDRAVGAEAIGHMLAYASMTDTRMLALLGDPDADMYELLFSFSSGDNKAEFLRLLKLSQPAICEEDEIMVPVQAEIEAAQPISRVLPEDVMLQVTITSTMLFGGQSESLQ
jgi:hypothetical protein